MLRNTMPNSTAKRGPGRPRSVYSAPIPRIKTRRARSSAKTLSRRPRSAHLRDNRMSEQEKAQALSWLKEGVSVAYIADTFKVTRPTIYNLRDKYAPKLNRRRGGYRHGQRRADAQAVQAAETSVQTPAPVAPQPVPVG